MKAPSSEPQTALGPEEIDAAESFFQMYISSYLANNHLLHPLNFELTGLNSIDEVVFRATTDLFVESEYAKEQEYRRPLIDIARNFSGMAAVDHEILSSDANGKLCRFEFKIKIPKWKLNAFMAK